MPRSAADWFDSLSPWPDAFGLERMQELLSDLGEPQLEYPSIHVVGTNGKTTVTRMIEEILLAEGLCVASYTSPFPHERIRVAGRAVDEERALAAVRAVAEPIGATQFEVLTAAALAAFAVARVDVAVVEAGLGGRFDATNVLRTQVVVLTNVALDHTEVLGSTREEIAAEKLAVVQPHATVVLGEPEWEPLVADNPVVTTARSSVALAVAASEAFLARGVDAAPAERVALPGRLERRGEHPLEIWDGAHNVAALGWLLPRLPDRRWTVVASVVEDKDVDGMLAALSAIADGFVATTTSNRRALPAAELARRAQPFFAEVEAIADPDAALAAGRERAGEDGAVLVTGSLYLLADLSKHQYNPYDGPGR